MRHYFIIIMSEENVPLKCRRCKLQNVSTLRCLFCSCCNNSEMLDWYLRGKITSSVNVWVDLPWGLHNQFSCHFHQSCCFFSLTILFVCSFELFACSNKAKHWENRQKIPNKNHAAANCNYYYGSFQNQRTFQLQNSWKTKLHFSDFLHIFLRVDHKLSTHK